MVRSVNKFCFLTQKSDFRRIPHLAATAWSFHPNMVLLHQHDLSSPTRSIPIGMILCHQHMTQLFSGHCLVYSINCATIGPALCGAAPFHGPGPDPDPGPDLDPAVVHFSQFKFDGLATHENHENGNET